MNDRAAMWGELRAMVHHHDGPGPELIDAILGFQERSEEALGYVLGVLGASEELGWVGLLEWLDENALDARRAVSADVNALTYEQWDCMWVKAIELRGYRYARALSGDISYMTGSDHEPTVVLRAGTRDQRLACMCEVAKEVLDDEFLMHIPERTSIWHHHDSPWQLIDAARARVIHAWIDPPYRSNPDEFRDELDGRNLEDVIFADALLDLSDTLYACPVEFASGPIDGESAPIFAAADRHTMVFAWFE